MEKIRFEFGFESCQVYGQMNFNLKLSEFDLFLRPQIKKIDFLGFRRSGMNSLFIGGTTLDYIIWSWVEPH